MKIEILDEAEADLIEGFHFYERQETGLGLYFLDSLFSDIDSLLLRLQIGDLLLRGGNGIGTGDKAARRRFLLAMMMSARASFVGSPDCLPFWAFQNSSCFARRSS